MKPLLFAHRGGKSKFNENSLEAFRYAFKLGADGVECDIQEDDNGEIILVHNYLYDKTKTYHLFSDFLNEFKNSGRIEIELKTISSTFVKKVADLIKEYQPADYELTSSILPLLPLIKQELPDALTGVIFKQYLLEDWMTEEFKISYIKSYLKLLNANVLHLNLESYTPSLVEQLHQNGYRLHTHLKDSNLETFNKVKNLGIDQCTIDNLTLINKVIGEVHL